MSKKKILTKKESRLIVEILSGKEPIHALAEYSHIQYLRAIRSLSKKSYNPNADIPYSKLSKEQKQIDLYIAFKVMYIIEAIRRYYG